MNVLGPLYYIFYNIMSCYNKHYGPCYESMLTTFVHMIYLKLTKLCVEYVILLWCILKYVIITAWHLM